MSDSLSVVLFSGTDDKTSPSDSKSNSSGVALLM